MRTILAGLSTLRRVPRSGLPFVLEGAAVALAVGLGLLPAVPQSVIAGAVFPLDVLFDVKRSIGFAHSWAGLVIALLFSTAVRSTILASAIHLGGDSELTFRELIKRSARTVATAIVALFPGASLFFIGVVLRYAPFVWLAALVTFLPALLMARRAAWLGREDLGRAAPAPYLGSFLVNSAILCLGGAAMSALAHSGRWSAALIPLLLAPVQAAFFFGWRAQVAGTAPAEKSRVFLGLTAACLLAFAVLVIGDRMSGGDFGNRTVAGREGSLVLLGGADSTSTSGSLYGFDVRVLGWEQSAASLLSYSDGSSYTKADTRRDLDDIAPVIERQIESGEPPVSMFGHSQAALILDRMIVAGSALPENAVVISPPPPTAPDLNVPAPDEVAQGRPGGDLARGFSWLLDRVGLSPYDVDAGAGPTNLGDVEPPSDGGVRRMSVWALADSVWLDSDWRRENEMNLVSVSDHVGAINDLYALDRARRFYAGDEIGDDEGSWRGALATTLRYAFAPWRP